MRQGSRNNGNAHDTNIRESNTYSPAAIRSRAISYR